MGIHVFDPFAQLFNQVLEARRWGGLGLPEVAVPVGHVAEIPMALRFGSAAFPRVAADPSLAMRGHGKGLDVDPSPQLLRDQIDVGDDVLPAPERPTSPIFCGLFQM